MVRVSPGSPSQWNATWSPRPAATWRSRQLSLTLSLPPTNHLAKGSSQSQIVSHSSSSRAGRRPGGPRSPGSPGRPRRRGSCRATSACVLERLRAAGTCGPRAGSPRWSRPGICGVAHGWCSVPLTGAARGPPCVGHPSDGRSRRSPGASDFGTPEPARSCLSMTSVNPTDATDAEDREELTWELFGTATRALAEAVAADAVAARHRGRRRSRRADRGRRAGLRPGREELRHDQRRVLHRASMSASTSRWCSRRASQLRRRDRAQACWWSTTSPTPATPCAWSARCCAQHVDEARTAVLYHKTPLGDRAATTSWKQTDAWINFPWSVLPPVAGLPPR